MSPDEEALARRRIADINKRDPMRDPEANWGYRTSAVFRDLGAPYFGKNMKWEAMEHGLNMREQEREQLERQLEIADHLRNFRRMERR